MIYQLQFSSEKAGANKWKNVLDPLDVGKGYMIYFANKNPYHNGQYTEWSATAAFWFDQRRVTEIQIAVTKQFGKAIKHDYLNKVVFFKNLQDAVQFKLQWC